MTQYRKPAGQHGLDAPFCSHFNILCFPDKVLGGGKHILLSGIIWLRKNQHFKKIVSVYNWFPFFPKLQVARAKLKLQMSFSGSHKLADSISHIVGLMQHPNLWCYTRVSSLFAICAWPAYLGTRTVPYHLLIVKWNKDKMLIWWWDINHQMHRKTCLYVILPLPASLIPQSLPFTSSRLLQNASTH